MDCDSVCLPFADINLNSLPDDNNSNSKGSVMEIDHIESMYCQEEDKYIIEINSPCQCENCLNQVVQFVDIPDNSNNTQSFLVTTDFNKNKLNKEICEGTNQSFFDRNGMDFPSIENNRSYALCSTLSLSIENPSSEKISEPEKRPCINKRRKGKSCKRNSISKKAKFSNTFKDFAISCCQRYQNTVCAKTMKWKAVAEIIQSKAMKKFQYIPH